MSEKATVVVPEFLGLASEPAIERVRELELTPDIETRPVAKGATAGVICDQLPLGGGQVSRGGVVSLVIAEAEAEDAWLSDQSLYSPATSVEVEQVPAEDPAVQESAEVELPEQESSETQDALIAKDGSESEVPPADIWAPPRQQPDSYPREQTQKFTVPSRPEGKGALKTERLRSRRGLTISLLLFAFLAFGGVLGRLFAPSTPPPAAVSAPVTKAAPTRTSVKPAVAKKSAPKSKLPRRMRPKRVKPVLAKPAPRQPQAPPKQAARRPSAAPKPKPVPQSSDGIGLIDDWQS